MILGGSRKGESLRRARARGPRPRLPDRRDRGRARGRARPRGRSLSSAAATSSRGRRPRRPQRPGRARSSCSRRRARATTSSATSSSAARNSGGWCRTCPGEARTPGVERPRSRHARPRRLRDGDGLQRDLGVGRDRRGELRPTTSSARRSSRCSGSGCSSSRDAGATGRCGTLAPVARPGQSLCLLAVRARRRPERQRRPPVDRPRRRRRSSPRSSRSSRSCIWIALYLAKRPVPTHARRADEADRARHGGVFCALVLAEPDLGTVIAICVDGRRDAARRRRAGAAARRVGGDRLGRHCGRDLVRAVPAHALLQLHRPVARRAGGRLPDGAGDDRARLGRGLRRRARARASRRSSTSPRRTRT